MIKSLRGVDIVAAGESSRLREAIDFMGYPPNYPKHLLPTGNPRSETLIGRIVRQALEAPLETPPLIHANRSNGPFIAEHDDIDAGASVVEIEPDTMFGPFMRKLIREKRRTLGASGDHYVGTFDWKGLLDHHESSIFPVTFVVGQCIEVDEGAVFDVDPDGRITRFYRPERTTSESMINIGIYVFDPASVALKSLERIGLTSDTVDPVQASPELIVTRLIEDGLLGAYVLRPNSSFNINTPETYQALLAHTASSHV